MLSTVGRSILIRSTFSRTHVIPNAISTLKATASKTKISTNRQMTMAAICPHIARMGFAAIANCITRLLSHEPLALPPTVVLAVVPHGCGHALYLGTHGPSPAQPLMRPLYELWGLGQTERSTLSFDRSSKPYALPSAPYLS